MFSITRRRAARAATAVQASVAGEAKHPLTAEQLGHYARKAWVAAPGFFSKAETARISAWVDELEQRPERTRRGNGLPRAEALGSVGESDTANRGFLSVSCRIRRPRRGPAQGRDRGADRRAGRAVQGQDQLQNAGWRRLRAASGPASGLVRSTRRCSSPRWSRSTRRRSRMAASRSPMRRGTAGLIGEEWQPLDPRAVDWISADPDCCRAGRRALLRQLRAARLKMNGPHRARRILYVTYNARIARRSPRALFRGQAANFPPDIERKPGTGLPLQGLSAPTPRRG